VLTSFQVVPQLATTQAVELDDKFKNVMPMGRYFYYNIAPGSSDSFAFLDTLTIRLESIFGDADLLVSLTKPNPRFEDSPQDVMVSRE
jgi:hypothetical protein